jgi:hypothetical protein
MKYEASTSESSNLLAYFLTMRTNLTCGRWLSNRIISVERLNRIEQSLIRLNSTVTIIVAAAGLRIEIDVNAATDDDNDGDDDDDNDGGDDNETNISSKFAKMHFLMLQKSKFFLAGGFFSNGGVEMKKLLSKKIATLSIQMNSNVIIPKSGFAKAQSISETFIVQ